MSTITVTTQAELDAALVTADSEAEWTDIHIRSNAGVWLYLTRTPDSSRVEAWGSSSVVARGSSSVVARGSSRVEAWDSSSVEAWDSSSVEARDSSSVVARGSSRVVAWGSSSVEAGDYVAVHLHSARATIDGGVLIDVTALDESDLTQWASYHGAKVSDGSLVLYKAVDADLKSERGFAYPIGETVECPDWTDTNDCGGGLHLSPHPHQALAYFRRATRFLRCVVAVDDLRPILGYPGDPAKAKARRVTVLAEVDIDGKYVS